MSEQRPWWLGDDNSSEQKSESGSSSDWANHVTTWVTWLQSLAQQKIVEPHREHTNPHEHPTCVLCRTSMLVETDSVPEGDDIIWVPTVIDSSLP